jgi:hypothetical protein
VGVAVHEYGGVGLLAGLEHGSSCLHLHYQASQCLLCSSLCGV